MTDPLSVVLFGLVCFIFGIILLAIAIYLDFGLSGVLGFLGLVGIVIGVLFIIGTR